MNQEQKQKIFFNRASSISQFVEETLGTDTFLKITMQKATVNPYLTISSKVMYINEKGKLKMGINYNFHVELLRSFDWLDNFIDVFFAQEPSCREIIGVLNNDQNIPWYIDFVTNELKLPNAIDRDGSKIHL